MAMDVEGITGAETTRLMSFEWIGQDEYVC